MGRYAVIHAPEAALQAARRRAAPRSGVPLVLLDPWRRPPAVSAACVRAREAGVAVGMTVPQARARAASLVFLHPAPQAERSLQQDLLACGWTWSPRVEDTALGTVTVDVGAVEEGVDWMERGHAVVARLAGVGVEAAVGVGATPWTAWCAARLAAPVRILTPGAERAELARLPIEAADPDPAVLEVLRLWRVRTFGDLADLSREEVGKRLGVAGLEVWDRAVGGRPRVLCPAAFPEVFEEEAEPGFALESLEPLLFLLRRQLGQLVLRLGGAGKAVGGLRLELALEDRNMQAYDFSLAEPTLDPDRLLRVILARVEGARTVSPIVRVRLRAEPASRDLRQEEIFEASLRDPARFAETVSSLLALYGPERVGRPAMEASWRPDPCRLAELTDVVGLPEELMTRVVDRPILRRWRPPAQARVEVDGDGRPLSVDCLEASGRVVAWRGPWESSGLWWQAGGWRRREWDVELVGGGLYRLACCSDRGWLVEGMYD